ncbi:MAG: hypothetical protein ACRDN0_19855 [Trebonia sp.]
MYVATLPLGYSAADPSTVLMYNLPGRSVSVHPVNGNAMAAFIFRSPALPGLDNRDVAACKQIVLDAYRGGGWELPRLLDRLSAADDLYFDSVSRVRLMAWSQGRVALLGDAVSCMSLFGNGSSLAVTGAETLARALDVTPTTTRWRSAPTKQSTVSGSGRPSAAASSPARSSCRRPAPASPPAISLCGYSPGPRRRPRRSWQDAQGYSACRALRSASGHCAAGG